jgi:hypothetical protein
MTIMNYEHSKETDKTTGLQYPVRMQYVHSLIFQHCLCWDFSGSNTTMCCLWMMSAKTYAQSKYNRRKENRKLEVGKKRVVKTEPVKEKLKTTHKDKGYGPQSGVGTGIQKMSEMMAKCGQVLAPELANMVENIVALFFVLQACNTTRDYMAALTLYVKTHVNKSLVGLVCGALENMYGQVYDVQSGDIDRPAWLSLLKEVQTNWSMIVLNPGFQKLSHTMSLCIALGLCEASDLDFSIGGIQIFATQALTKHVTAVDVIDAAFSTITHFVEGGYMCFKAQSMAPLLYGDLDTQMFQEMYSQCMRCNKFHRCGNLHLEGNMKENDYAKLLSKCLEQGKLLVRMSGGTAEKVIIARACDAVRIWQADFMQSRVQGGLREAPYCIGIFGGTSVGKSSVANMLMVTTLMANGHAATDDCIVTFNEDDKYQSNMRSDVNGIFLDDLGNTKPEFVERSPCSLIVQLVNNVRSYAHMADLDQKGKVAMEPKVVVITKNVKDSCANKYSNEPASIIRRERVTLTVKVRQEFSTNSMLDAQKVFKKFGPRLPDFPDLWDITVQRGVPESRPIEGRAPNIEWLYVCDDQGNEMKDVSIKDVMHYIAADSALYYQEQASLVKASNGMAERLKICDVCRTPYPEVCRCPPCDEDPETTKELDTQSMIISGIGVQTSNALHRWLRRWTRRYTPRISSWTSDFEGMICKNLMDRVKWLEDSPYMQLCNWIPDKWIGHSWVRDMVLFNERKQLRTRIYCTYAISALGMVAGWQLRNHYICWPLIPIWGGIALNAARIEKTVLYENIMQRRDAVPMALKHFRENHVEWISMTCAGLAALYAAIRVYKVFRTQQPIETVGERVRNFQMADIFRRSKPKDQGLTHQGKLDPREDSDVMQRDREENVWGMPEHTELPSSVRMKTTTVQQLERIVFNNLCHMTGYMDESYVTTDVFFPCSNVLLVPQHMLVLEEMQCSFKRSGRHGSTFKGIISRRHSVNIPDTDLAVVWMPSGGDWKNLLDYFPYTKFSGGMARLVYKDADCAPRVSDIMMKMQQITVGISYWGATYDVEFPTFKGLCMATLIKNTLNPFIAGFHLAGKDGQLKGAGGVLYRHQLEKALEVLGHIPGVVLSASSGTMPTSKYGVQFYIGKHIHVKSPARFLPQDSTFFHYGEVIGRSRYYTAVEPTKISPIVEKYMGHPNIWSGPKFHVGYPWQASLEHLATPAIGVEGVLLERACRDYLGGIIAAMRKIPQCSADIHVLTDEETVNGIVGQRFVDKMKGSTSIGYPLTGPKSEYMSESLMPDDVTRQDCVCLDEKFWEEANAMEEEYKAGRRCYPIFKACLKDEPTLSVKDKVRVFEASPVALQLLVRKYFLPIARLMSILPLASECAVGINALGPEWNEMTNHITRYGEDRILAGDYSKYDLRMPSQMVFAAFGVMMSLAHEAGYSRDDMDVMRGIATDVAYPVLAYNGDLIGLLGSNPSGQNLTVYINCIVNSLYLRCALYYIYPVEQVEFRNVCALMTYGDDCKGSVNVSYPEYNHLNVAEFLCTRGMVFTMPDKESEPSPYMKDSEADFLKRFSVYHDRMQCYLGALDEKSIFKSLHAILKSKHMSNMEVCMANIDGALVEWFAHGPDVYEMRRFQLKAVAEEAGISLGCLGLGLSYEDRVLAWCHKYGYP